MALYIYVCIAIGAGHCVYDSCVCAPIPQSALPTSSLFTFQFFFVFFLLSLTLTYKVFRGASIDMNTRLGRLERGNWIVSLRIGFFENVRDDKNAYREKSLLFDNLQRMFIMINSLVDTLYANPFTSYMPILPYIYTLSKTNTVTADTRRCCCCYFRQSCGMFLFLSQIQLVQTNECCSRTAVAKANCCFPYNQIIYLLSWSKRLSLSAEPFFYLLLEMFDQMFYYSPTFILSY